MAALRQKPNGVTFPRQSFSQEIWIAMAMISVPFSYAPLCFFVLLLRYHTAEHGGALPPDKRKEHPMDTPLEKPTNDERDAWRAYWRQRGQPWRTEPEIPTERQAYLNERHGITPDIKQGIYPFKDLEPKLTRADIEWLLATHENGRGPIDWKDESQRDRLGLDLRGADLSGTARDPFDLLGLPLARTQFGLTEREGSDVTVQAATLAGANLTFADLSVANIQGAYLSYANLQGVVFFRADLQGSYLGHANMQGAYFGAANMQGAYLRAAQLQGADLNEVKLQNSDLVDAQLQGANLRSAKLQNVNLHNAQLQNADFGAALLQGANLSYANMQSSNLRAANMQSANLGAAQLQGANLSYANMQSIDLHNATLDGLTRLDSITLDAHITLSDVSWGGANVVNIDWSPVSQLGDETSARQRRGADNVMKNRPIRLLGYRAAVRAYRLLVTTLRDQGMNEEADRFAYRAQVCQRAVLRLKGKRGQSLWSGVLDLIAGYGYRPVRSFIAYVVIILGFAAMYFFFGQGSHPLTPEESFVVSMTAFHGRGFFANQFQPGDPQALAAAFEAFIGLMIEVSFIATFTQRFFGK
jgi:uncharacterized protein YjbI with pentapeptide repeats